MCVRTNSVKIDVIMELLYTVARFLFFWVAYIQLKTGLHSTLGVRMPVYEQDAPLECSVKNAITKNIKDKHSFSIWLYRNLVVAASIFYRTCVHRSIWCKPSSKEWWDAVRCSLFGRNWWKEICKSCIIHLLLYVMNYIPT